MFKRKASKETQTINEIIDSVTADMLVYGPDSEEYKNLLDYFERLTALKTINRPARVSRDQIALVFGNILGILIIVAYEQKHVLNSKSLGFIPKLKG